MLGITKRQDTRVNAMQPDGVILSGHLQPLYPVDHKRRRTKTTAPWALGLVLAFTIAALWGTMIYQTHTAPDTVITQLGWTVTAGVASFCVAIWVLCSVKIGEVRRYNEQVRSEDESHVVHQRGMENKHMDQRVPAMNAAKDIQVATIGGAASVQSAQIQADAQVEVAMHQSQAAIEAARYQALAAQQTQLQQLQEQFFDFQLRADERERDRLDDFFHRISQLMLQAGESDRDRQHQSRESQRDREHRSSEADKDRQATLEQMITRFEGKINELKTRMEYENPSAAARMQEEVILMEGFLTQARKINEITDPVLRKQMFDRLKKGWE